MREISPIKVEKVLHYIYAIRETSPTDEIFPWSIYAKMLKC